MKETSMLFPYNPEEFWERMQNLIHDEMVRLIKARTKLNDNEFKTPGLTYKPLYKTAELCNLFQVSRPTIYSWIGVGKLKPYKIRSRVYFLWDDVQSLFKGEV